MKEKFLFLYQNEYGTLNDSQFSGLSFLLDNLIADIADIRWVSYMLATVKHECAGKWQPIAEFGRGKGREYGVPDPQTGETYYGRGYVQLTWRDNYAAMSKVTGCDLVEKPDLAMQPEVAYKILTYGMTHGSFTGVGLPKYIHDVMCDYVRARKVINGLDCAEKIAGYATTIQRLLEESYGRKET